MCTLVCACTVNAVFDDVIVGCFVAVALEARDNDATLDNHTVHLYAPVTATGHSTRTPINNRFLNTFQQFCKVGLCIATVCTLRYVVTLLVYFV